MFEMRIETELTAIVKQEHTGDDCFYYQDCTGIGWSALELTLVYNQE
jgi:hypothetical protein